MKEADRLIKLPIYVFAQLDALKAKERAKGADLIDLGMGNPDVAPPPQVIESLRQALTDPENFRYPSFEGAPDFKEAVAGWCRRQYGININPHHEVVALIGSKEGVVHLAMAYINPGDITLVPMPAYPAHFNGTILSGGEPYVLPTTERNGFLPDLKDVDPAIADAAKMLIISYPTNPTAACAPRSFFEEAVAFAKKHKLILVSDFAYAELYFEKEKPISALSIAGAKDVCIEFHTLSKTFGMAGWRIGFAVGNPQLVESLRKIKTNLDYGIFTCVQKAAITALNLKDGYIDNVRAIYKRRRDLFVEGLNRLGWKLKKPAATMYLWVPVPAGYNATSFSLHLLETTGVVAAPGVAFGSLGEGYVRFALVEKEDRLEEALRRMETAGIRFGG